MSGQHSSRGGYPRLIRILSVPIILIWLAATAATNLLVPKLEVVGANNGRINIRRVRNDHSRYHYS